MAHILEFPRLKIVPIGRTPVSQTQRTAPAALGERRRELRTESRKEFPLQTADAQSACSLPELGLDFWPEITCRELPVGGKIDPANAQSRVLAELMVQLMVAVCVVAAVLVLVPGPL